MDAEEKAMFANYSAALRLWCRRYNSAEIADLLKVPEWQVCRWLSHWRELARAN